jgi:hypothetical protein
MKKKVSDSSQKYFLYLSLRIKKTCKVCSTKSIEEKRKNEKIRKENEEGKIL